MNLEQILNALASTDNDSLPIDGINQAKAQWSLVCPEILNTIDVFITDPALLTTKQQSTLFYGTFLLAEMKHNQALDKVLELFSCQDTFLTPIESVFGDTLTELIPSVFYILADGNPEILSDYILDSHLAMYGKGSAIEVVFAQYEAGAVSRSQLFEYVSYWKTTFLTNLSLTNRYLLSVLATSCIDYQLDEFKNEFIALCSKDVFDEDRAPKEEIKAWDHANGVKQIESGLIYTEFNLAEIFATWHTPDNLTDDGAQQQPHQQQMDDEITQLMAQATSELRSNTLFGEEYILQNSVPVSSLTAKVGRNDPCPCGSGKKYKKCCLH
ncbi:DUF1186 domain-containing protein (plasmid) [Catenovulum sp. SX2]|uniref:DUF1186 domain-containing protein n=1 Tax=Catenovulum sp. SX2 TaxID=3398614 RepID=UPI003F84F0A6